MTIVEKIVIVPEPVKVTQGDRDAAAELYLAEEIIISSGPAERIGTHSPFDLARAESLRSGTYDDWDMVQAFARHRAHSEAPLRAEVEWLREAVTGIGDDYMTSEQHHPGYVLIPTAKFKAIRAALQHHEAGR